MTPVSDQTLQASDAVGRPMSDPTTPGACQLPAAGEHGRATCNCRVHTFMWGLTAVIVSLGVAVMGGLAWYTYQTNLATQTTRAGQTAEIQWPATIDATAAVSSEKYSVATGMVGDEAEGFFVLDHNSGLLQCKVLYPRMRSFMASFTVNVGDALGAAGKGGSYLMVTGQADFQRSSTVPVATTVVYVLNTSTGAYAAYAIPFNRVLVNSGQPQTGQLVLLGADQANPVVDRDALR